MRKLWLGRGHVFHSRREGADNSFKYPSFFIQFDLDEELSLTETFRRAYRGFLSFQSTDYLRGEKAPLKESVRRFLKENCAFEPQEVWLHTMPRMFGYVFNPVSFWLCRRDGLLEAVLVEVNNTFGERHFYWIPPQAELASGGWIRAQKVFHVSPFFPVEGFYQFRFQSDSSSSRIDINYHGPDGNLRLATYVQGVLAPLDSVSIWSLLKAYGWMTPLVVFRIHYQALRLWIRKSKFYRKPLPPSKEVTS